MNLADRFRAVRSATVDLCHGLSPEDQCVQSMPDASPVKWHLAHTTWFFEVFVLGRVHPALSSFHPQFSFLFNSYYEAVGPRHPRPRRGLLSRPTLDEVHRYRAHVDEEVLRLLEHGGVPSWADVLEIGLHHEQQHQELILTDLKHLFLQNPLYPAYRDLPPRCDGHAPPVSWHPHPGGVVEIGAGPDGFAFDNERPRHPVLLAPFELASRAATNGEYLEFVEDGGYRRPELWLSDGWAVVQRDRWDAPGCWVRDGDAVREFTLGGLRELAPGEPVVHLSYYEADAFARWSNARLPTEAEWEAVAGSAPVRGNFVGSGLLHPTPAESGPGLRQLFGDVWEWTASAHAPYPGYRAPHGALGEYNGKFMCNQLVLRGGSCATPASHLRASYRNFFYPDTRWQFSGVRLARDAR